MQTFHLTYKLKLGQNFTISTISRLDLLNFYFKAFIEFKTPLCSVMGENVFFTLQPSFPYKQFCNPVVTVSLFSREMLKWDKFFSSVSSDLYSSIKAKGANSLSICLSLSHTRTFYSQMPWWKAMSCLLFGRTTSNEPYITLHTTHCTLTC